MSYYGGVLDYVDAPTMLYRQHSSNVVGAIAYSKGKAIIDRLLNLRNVIADNIKLFKDVNKIGKISIFSYLYHKIRYMLIR